MEPARAYQAQFHWHEGEGRLTLDPMSLEEDCLFLVEAVRLLPIRLPRTALPLGTCIPCLVVAPPPLCAAFRALAIGSRPVPPGFPSGDTGPVIRVAVY